MFENHARPAKGEDVSSKLRRNIERLAVLGVLILYVVGVRAAYHISLAMGHSRDWVIIHAVYSWIYVGFSFGGWVSHHRNQPLAPTLRQFLKFMKL